MKKLLLGVLIGTLAGAMLVRLLGYGYADERVKDSKDTKDLAVESPPPLFSGGGTYEGRSATDWAKDLAAGKDTEKAKHALLRLGRDSVVPLTDLLKLNKADLSDEVLALLLTGIEQGAPVTQVLENLMKQENFKLRLNAVLRMGRLAERDAGLTEKLKPLITRALDDRDKAVVEAAEMVLESLSGKSVKIQRINQLMAHAAQFANEGEFDTAVQLLTEARALIPDKQFMDDENNRANDIEQRIGQMHTMASKQVELEHQQREQQKLALAAHKAGKADEAVAILLKARALAPNNRAMSDELERNIQSVRGEDRKKNQAASKAGGDQF